MKKSKITAKNDIFLYNDVNILDILLKNAYKLF